MPKKQKSQQESNCGKPRKKEFDIRNHQKAVLSVSQNVTSK